MRPKFAKPDSNQQRIIDDLRQVGAIVWVTASLPTPILDLIVHWRGHTVIAEVKQSGLEDELTPGERLSILELREVGVDVVIATCAEDVIEAFLALDEPRWRVVDQEAMVKLNTAMGDALTVLGGLAASAMSPMRFRERIGKALNSLEAAHDLLCQATQFK